MPDTGQEVTYPLCFRDTDGRMVLRLKYEGVTLRADRLEWTAEGRFEERYVDIESIGLTVGYVPRSGAIGNCRIIFRNLRTLNVTSSNATGLPDEARGEAYAAFLRDLHGRLSEADRRRIAFRAGNSQARENFGWVVMAVAGVLFVGLPLGLFFFTREWKALGLMLAGGALVWPLWNTLRKNRPRTYDPQHLDEDVFP